MNNHQNQPNMQQAGSGLTRYRSAPSSYFDSFLNASTGFGTDDFDQIFNPRASSPETQKIFSRFMNNSEITVQENRSYNMSSQPQPQSQSQPKLNNSQFPPPRHKEHVNVQQHQLQRQQSNDYSSVSQIMYQDVSSNSGVENSYGALLGSNRSAQMKMGGGGGSGLIRQSSSPAGLFAGIDIEKKFGAMRNMGNFGAGNSSNAEASFSSASRFSNPNDFSSRHSSSGMMMPPISETGSRLVEDTNPSNTNRQFGEAHADEGDYIPGFSMNAWDDSTILSDNFLNELAEDSKNFPNANGSDDHQIKTEGRTQPTTRLTHHLSLPSNSAELEKLLQDSVPCKIRAKRGCATHPRSIAERVRRTKISERMRKLQELVPNMEKQTNTSDMLDLAVNYIKDLQRQVKKLSGTREKCSCMSKEES